MLTNAKIEQAKAKLKQELAYGVYRINQVLFEI